MNDLFPTCDWRRELSGEARLQGGSRDQAESALFSNGRWEPAVGKDAVVVQRNQIRLGACP